MTGPLVSSTLQRETWDLAAGETDVARVPAWKFVPAPWGSGTILLGEEETRRWVLAPPGVALEGAPGEPVGQWRRAVLTTNSNANVIDVTELEALKVAMALAHLPTWLHSWVVDATTTQVRTLDLFSRSGPSDPETARAASAAASLRDELGVALRRIDQPMKVVVRAGRPILEGLFGNPPGTQSSLRPEHAIWLQDRAFEPIDWRSPHSYLAFPLARLADSHGAHDYWEACASCGHVQPETDRSVRAPSPFMDVLRKWRIAAHALRRALRANPRISADDRIRGFEWCEACHATQVGRRQVDDIFRCQRHEGQERWDSDQLIFGSSLLGFSAISERHWRFSPESPVSGTAGSELLIAVVCGPPPSRRPDFESLVDDMWPPGEIMSTFSGSASCSGEVPFSADGCTPFGRRKTVPHASARPHRLSGCLQSTVTDSGQLNDASSRCLTDDAARPASPLGVLCRLGAFSGQPRALLHAGQQPSEKPNESSNAIELGHPASVIPSC